MHPKGLKIRGAYFMGKNSEQKNKAGKMPALYITLWPQLFGGRCSSDNEYAKGNKKNGNDTCPHGNSSCLKSADNTDSCQNEQSEHTRFYSRSGKENKHIVNKVFCNTCSARRTASRISLFCFCTISIHFYTSFKRFCSDLHLYYISVFGNCQYNF
jgi:hypothetical protein